jgi:hypothetical protein
VGVVRTTDSYQGTYAIVLHNWYFYAQETLYLHDAISGKPEHLSGFYKYQTGGTEGLARGSLIVALLKTNGMQFDTIAKGIQYFDSTLIYKPFVTPLTYFSQNIPDSMSITVVNADRNCKTQGICHLLYIDGLSLSGSGTSVGSKSKDQEMSPYPNPVHDFLSFKNERHDHFTFRLYNVAGKMVINEPDLSGRQELDLTSLEEGVYFYQIFSAGRLQHSGKVVKE